MRPLFLAIRGISALVSAKVPTKFTLSVSRMTLISVCSLSTLMSPGIPALLTSSVNSGYFSLISLAARSMLSRSFSSTLTHPNTSMPCAFNSLTAFVARCSSRAPIITFQLLRPRCFAIPKPMPLLAPVTNTVLFIVLFSLYDLGLHFQKFNHSFVKFFYATVL